MCRAYGAWGLFISWTQPLRAGLTYFAPTVLGPRGRREGHREAVDAKGNGNGDGEILTSSREVIRDAKGAKEVSYIESRVRHFGVIWYTSRSRSG